jgi:hypothetical protein
LDARVSVRSGILLGEVSRECGRIVADIVLIAVEADVVGRAVNRPTGGTQIVRGSFVLSRFGPFGSAAVRSSAVASTTGREAEE